MISERPVVLFSGKFEHKLDPKSRVSVLSDWRDRCDGKFQLIDAQKKGYPVIKCYTQETFAEMIAYIRRKSEEMQATPKDIDDYVGDIIGRSYEAEVSTQGKLLIPKVQRERLRLSEMVVLVGRGEYFEFWNPEDYAAATAPATATRSRLDEHFGTLFG